LKTFHPLNNNINDGQSSLIDKDFNIPLDDIIDLEIFEDKISSNKEFRTKLVIIYILNNNCWVLWFYILYNSFYKN